MGVLRLGALAENSRAKTESRQANKLMLEEELKTQHLLHVAKNVKKLKDKNPKLIK